MASGQRRGHRLAAPLVRACLLYTSIQATITKNGTVGKVSVVNGPKMLQDAALEAVKTWRYRPYLLDGEPVEAETTVSVNFTM